RQSTALTLESMQGRIEHTVSGQERVAAPGDPDWRQAVPQTAGSAGENPSRLPCAWEFTSRLYTPAGGRLVRSRSRNCARTESLPGQPGVGGSAPGGLGWGLPAGQADLRW